MKIAFLILTAYESAGTEHAVITQANALAARHDVEILSVLQTAEEPHFGLDPRVRLRPLAQDVPGEPASVSDDDEVPREVADELRRRESRLVPRAWDPTFNGLCDPALERHLPEVEADVVVTVTPALLAVAVQLLPFSVRVVHQEHRASAQRTAGKTPLLAFAPRADLVTVLTDGSREWLAEQLGPTSPPLEVVPNALAPIYRPRSCLDSSLIVAAGRLVSEKRFDHLVEAFGTVADRIPEWRLRIFGSGPQRKHLMAQVEHLGLYDRVELPGVSSDMPSQWAQASICALTSRGPEGLPLVLQEALAAGVPLVSYDCPSGPRDLIDHGTNGLLVPSGSVERMADCLLRLAGDHELRRSMGRAALASAARYDSTTITTRWESLFSNVVDGAATSRRAATVGSATRGHLRPTTPVSAAEPPASAAAHLQGMTPAEARTHTLSVASAAAERAGGRWLVVPGRGREPTTVVVPAEDRDGFLVALSEAAGTEWLRLRDPGHEGWPERVGSVPTMCQALRRDASPTLVLEPWPEVGGVPTPVGRRCGVGVEFWAEGPGGDLVAPAPGRFSRLSAQDLVLTRAEVDGVEVTSVAAVLMPTMDEVEGSIDVVVSWDGGAAAVPGSDVVLRHQLRSLHHHAPWARSIHVVSPEGRLPGWLDRSHARIRIAGGPAPRLVDVPGLSELFVFLPPDVLLTRPLRPEMLFSGAGAFGVPHASPDEPEPAAAAVVRRDLGRSAYRASRHTVVPLAVSVLREASERWGAELEADPDLEPAERLLAVSYLAQQAGLASGDALPITLETSSVPAGGDLHRSVRALPRSDVDTVSLDVVAGSGLSPELRDGLRASLEVMFPRAAPWES